MSIYHIEAQVNGRAELYAFDSTATIRVSQTGTATSFPVEGGEDVSDHYVNNNTTISFDGIISDVKSIRREASEKYNKSTATFIRGLEALKKSKTPFKIHISNTLDAIDTCVFENLQFEQNKTQGNSGGINAFRISFSAKQIRFAERAQAVSVRAPVIKNDVAIEAEKSDDKKEPTPAKTSIIRDTVSLILTGVPISVIEAEAARQAEESGDT